MPLPALSLSVFALCSAAYSLIGPLLDVSHDLHVSVATAGQLLSAYAIGVTIGGPIVTVIGEQWGWRATFRVVACCAVLGVAAITLLVPSHLGGGQKLAIRAELATVTRKQVLWAPAITAACQTGRGTVRKDSISAGANAGTPLRALAWIGAAVVVVSLIGTLVALRARRGTAEAGNNPAQAPVPSSP
ncbi:hypothetical protein [Streptomyces griseochromogenes]|uniref:hypothetical protein n=1 Tax=Streptomyces griseochromogenes TaxID=68214 RepID=UPI0037AB5A98